MDVALVDLERIPCPNGCPPDDEPVVEGSDVLHGVPGRFQAVRCVHCTLVRTNPRPMASSIGRFYPPDYAPYATGSEAPPRSSFMGHLADRANGTLLPRVKPGVALEIGCATGRFLDRLRATGWRTFGIEQSSAAAEAARRRGHAVWIGRVEDAPALTEPPTLICGWMVVEHLHDPMTSLRKLHAMAAPGARLAVSVPDFGALGRRWLGEHWVLLDLPRHLFHYTPTTIVPLFRRCGWEVEHLTHSTTAGFALQSLAVHLQNRRYQRAARILREMSSGTRFGAARRALGLVLGISGQSGAMVVTARRNDQRSPG